MSIRLRLTLLYCAILALTLVIFDAALYFKVSNDTLALVDDALSSEELRIVDSNWFKLDQIDYSTKKLAAAEVFVQTMSLDGQVLDRTANLGDFNIPISQAAFQQVAAGSRVIDTVRADNGRLRVYSKRVRDTHGSQGVILVGRSLADYDQMRDTLRRLLIYGSAIGTIFAFGIGWFLAGTTLNPISMITRTAQKIGRERSFDRRVEYTGPNDELGRLSWTINEMLEELRAAYQSVDHTLQAQRRFVADASHELRTPLTTIRGNLELVRRDPPISEEDRQAVINDLVEETDRLIRLVNDLLVLARTDAGYRLGCVAVAIRPLIEEVCRQVQRLDPERSIRCEAVDDLAVEGDRDALKQVLLILMDNALKYSQTEIQITAGKRDSSVVIRVIDQGVGIPAERLGSIYERFYRADQARSGGGSGLGLAIAKALVEAQGGSIQVISQIEQGTVFSIILPMA